MAKEEGQRSLLHDRVDPFERWGHVWSVARHLYLYGKITQKEAEQAYGCWRLADVVYKIRKRLGWPIKTHTQKERRSVSRPKRRGGDVRGRVVFVTWAEYRLPRSFKPPADDLEWMELEGGREGAKA